MKCKTVRLTTLWIANVYAVNNGTRSTVRCTHREMGSIACKHRPLAFCRLPNLALIGLGSLHMLPVLQQLGDAYGF